MVKSTGNNLAVKLVVALLWVAWIIPAGMQFAAHKDYMEPVVLGPGVTEVKKLSDWAPYLKGSVNDCNIYVLDSGIPGGTMLVLGGTHPEEPTLKIGPVAAGRRRMNQALHSRVLKDSMVTLYSSASGFLIARRATASWFNLSKWSATLKAAPSQLAAAG